MPFVLWGRSFTKAFLFRRVRRSESPTPIFYYQIFDFGAQCAALFAVYMSWLLLLFSLMNCFDSRPIAANFSLVRKNRIVSLRRWKFPMWNPTPRKVRIHVPRPKFKKDPKCLRDEMRMGREILHFWKSIFYYVMDAHSVQYRNMCILKWRKNR